jgi:hypothetical protein
MKFKIDNIIEVKNKFLQIILLHIFKSIDLNLLIYKIQIFTNIFLILIKLT